MQQSKGMGIIETLFIVLIISVAVAIVLLVIPAQKDNRQQIKDIKTITSAIERYSKDNNENLPKSIREVPAEICKTRAEDCTGLVDLSALTHEEKYLLSIPVNPHGESTNGTGYTVKKDSNNKAVVTATIRL